MKKTTIILLLILLSFFGQSQNINKILSSNKSLKEKTTLLQDLANDYTKTKYDSAIYCAELADSLIQLTSNIEEKSNSKSFLALLNVAEPDKSMDAAYKNLELCKQSKNCKLISQAYLLLARVNWFIRNDQKVFFFFNLALKEAEKCNDKETLAQVYYKGSEFYYNTEQYEKSKEFTFKLAYVDTSRKNNPHHYADLGDLYRALNNLDSANFYYKIAVKIAELKKDTNSIANIYCNYALIPRIQKKYDLAIQYCNNAINLSKKIDNVMLTENSIRQLIDIYIDKGDFKNAKALLEERIKLNSGMKLSMLNDLEKLGDINYNLGNFKVAYENLHESFFYYRELKSGEASSKLTKIEENHLKKEKQLEIDIEKKEKESEKKMKNISFIGLTICFILIITVLLVLLNLKKSKKIITAQKNEVENQKHLVEEKQKEIVDSITYAKRLQEAILPAQEMVNKYLPENFILYTPKDLVAGDFYWMEVINEGDNETTFIAAADSTGHGVPGAMVSVVCSNALNRAVLEFKLIQTGQILDKTRELVLETFSKSTTDVKDGMDISLLAVIRKNNEIVEINWSGANNPLWFIENNEVKEVKANKQPIGKTDNPTPFTTHSIPYIKGTSFYLFTDGYADQFGGPKGKKFKYKQLEELLLELSTKEMSVQKETLNSKFEEWKSGIEQVDDVCVIGIKL